MPTGEVADVSKKSRILLVIILFATATVNINLQSLVDTLIVSLKNSVDNELDNGNYQGALMNSNPASQRSHNCLDA